MQILAWAIMSVIELFQSSSDGLDLESNESFLPRNPSGTLRLVLSRRLPMAPQQGCNKNPCRSHSRACQDSRALLLLTLATIVISILSISSIATARQLRARSLSGSSTTCGRVMNPISTKYYPIRATYPTLNSSAFQIRYKLAALECQRLVRR